MAAGVIALMVDTRDQHPYLVTEKDVSLPSKESRLGP